MTQAHRKPKPVVMLHDWCDLSMLHLAIDPKVLQPHIPLPLDTFEGTAYITLVPFCLQRIRLPILPQLTRQLLRPVSDHRLLNVRTYVKHRGDSGIYFISEFVNHRLNSFIAPYAYALPYRYTHLEPGLAATDAAELRYALEPDKVEPCTAAINTCDAFLLERYTAYASARGRVRQFRIHHPPWRYRPAHVEIHERSLLDDVGLWMREAQLTSAHACEPLIGVEIGAPRQINRHTTTPCSTAATVRKYHELSAGDFHHQRAASDRCSDTRPVPGPS